MQRFRQLTMVALAASLTAGCALPTTFQTAPLPSGAASFALHSGWQIGPGMPVARYNMGAGVIGGKLFLAGGISDRLHDELDRFDPATKTWSSLPAMPTPRYIGTAGAIGQQLIVAGGWNNGALRTVEAFDAQRGTWQTLPSLPFPILAGGGAVVRGKLHLIGGTAAGNLFDTHLTYDPQAKTWQQLPAQPWSRAAMAVTTDGTTIYTFGGWDGSSSPMASRLAAAYDVRSGKWEELPKMPAGRALATATVADGEIYVMGGGGEEGWIVDTTLIYNPQTRQWRSGPSLQSTRSGSSAAAFGRTIVVAGSGIGDGAPSLELLTAERHRRWQPTTAQRPSPRVPLTALLKGIQLPR